MTARRGVALTPMETRLDVIVRIAALADELGYELFALPEAWGLDSTPVLAKIAGLTNRIHVASGVLSVWGRTPATLAMTAATLHQISGARYVLGLGASTRALAEGFHDTAFEHPADKLRDVLTDVRALLAGHPAPLRRTRSARPLRLAQPPAPDLPLWIAALGHRTVQVATELADGWLPALVPRDQLADQAAQLRKAATRPFTIAAGPFAVAGQDPAAAREIAATCVAWYLAAMGDVYARSVSAHGYAAEVSAIRAANPRPSPRRGSVPPDAQVLLDQLTAYGTPDQVREQLCPWEQMADITMICLPPAIPWPAIEATLLATAPAI